MSARVLLALGLLLGGCGDAGPSPNQLAQANHLTSKAVAQSGDYCCYVNGAATSDSPEACATDASGCVWSTTYDEVDGSGRGTLCGYLVCPQP